MRPSIITIVIVEFITVVKMVELYIGLKIPDNPSLLILEFIILGKMLGVDLCINILDTIIITIVEQELILTGDMDIGIISYNPNSITKVDVADFLFYQFLIVLLMIMFMKTRDYNILFMKIRGVI